MSLNTLLNARTNLKLLTNERLPEFIIDIDKETERGVYCANIILSLDFVETMADARRQFEYTVKQNQEMALEKKNSVKAQNDSYKENLQSYIKFVNETFYTKGIPMYLEKIVTARAALRLLQKIGIKRWFLKFAVKYRYFKTKKEQAEFLSKSPKHIEDYLKPDIEKELNEFSE